MGDLLLGIDVGTSGCKVTVVDRQGRVVEEGFGEYRTYHPHPGWSEQNPDDWFDVASGVLQAVFARGTCRPEQIAALSLDGSTHNAVLADASFRPLRRAIMWTDQRSAGQAARLDREAGEEIFQTAYQKPSATWTLPQVLWIKESEPDVLKRTARILFTKDYVRYRLTGTWETDHIEAQGSLFYDMRRRGWSASLCGLAGVPVETLPPLVEPTDVVGSVTPAAAEATGLREGTPVVAGCSDSAVEDYAAGAIEPGNMILKLATAGNVNVMTAEAHPHPKTLTYSHVIPGLWYTVVATNTAASAERWFRDHFCGEEVARARNEGMSPYALMHEQAAGMPPGAEGLFFHPYLLGERAPYWDANLRGSFIGATMRHGKAHFLRALLEGVAYSLRDCFRTIVELGLKVDDIRLIGGGAKSALWSQIIADVFARPIIRPAGCDASFGAALLAGVGVGLFANAAEAVRCCTRVRDVVQPNPEAARVYAELFPMFCRIHDDLAETYTELTGLLDSLNPQGPEPKGETGRAGAETRPLTEEG
ncbi:MAG: xylulokinase [Thermoguttaceae bacterium]|jgi:xylulokinase|nr:xylulokinase [Thermoguttaceae bacterium]